MNPILLIGGVVVLIAVILLVVGLSGRPAGQELVEERLGDTDKKRKPKEKKAKRESVVGAAVDRAVEGRGFAQNIATQLARANLKWTVGEFLVMRFVVAVGLALLFFVMKRIVLVPVGFIGGFFIPGIYLSSRKNKRLKDFNDQLGDALNLMVNSLRAGYSTMQAMEVISDEMPIPISEEFGRVVMELQLGVPFDTGMSNLLRRVPSADMDLVITAMSVQREVGGNLAEVLDAISFTIRERVRIKGEIKAMTAQGRITGYVVTGLPFALGGFIYMVNPDFMGGLVKDPCGWIMIGISLFMIGLGYFVINKIVSIEV
ncbi:MAG TPA: type II secretion system F family protein [Anaerolineae bacterium]|nr:type II secretion system F family protein [Anaerolineae bacterium]HQI84985.1 type II secretion system F family protein [Anaerolineae bacterium]